jgi:purine nucleosidase
VIVIGGFTNLAMLELARPGSLHGVAVVAMSGWFAPAAEGLPQWGPEMDFNTQVDTRAAEILGASSVSLTLVPLPVAMGAWLRRRDLDRLRAVGALGRLLANQSETHAHDAGFDALARAHAGLPDDLVNFHWDPVTCAVALGWPGAQVEARHLSTRLVDGVLTFVEDPAGVQHRVVTSIDGDAFGELWLTAIELAAAAGQ